MANVKITDLTTHTNPALTDVLPIVDVGADVTKKVSVGEVVGKITGDVDVATDGTSSITAGAIVDADVNAAAAIAGTKIDPDFGSQTVETTGVFSAGGGAQATPSISFTGDLDTGLWSPSANTIAASTAGSERLRVDSNGLTKISTNGSNSYLFVSNSDTTAGNAISIIQGGTTNTNDTTTHLIRFRRNDGTEIGKIRRGGFSSIAFDTTSDYRLKTNVASLVNAIERVKELNPIQFNWVDDTSDTPTVVDGFLAHEAQTVVPEAVSGYKDEVDDKGNPVIQGIDQSKLVPLLTAALQEALAEIESLKARVTAIEP